MPINTGKSGSLVFPSQWQIDNAELIDTNGLSGFVVEPQDLLGIRVPVLWTHRGTLRAPPGCTMVSDGPSALYENLTWVTDVVKSFLSQARTARPTGSTS